MDFYFAFGAWGRVACVGNQVNQDLFDLGAVGLERETGIRLVEGEVRALEQLFQVVEKLVHTDGCVLRRGHTGQFAVVLREVEQALAAAVDGLQGLLHLAVLLGGRFCRGGLPGERLAQ